LISDPGSDAGAAGEMDGSAKFGRAKLSRDDELREIQFGKKERPKKGFMQQNYKFIFKISKYPIIYRKVSFIWKTLKVSFFCKNTMQDIH